MNNPPFLKVELKWKIWEPKTRNRLSSVGQSVITPPIGHNVFVLHSLPFAALMPLFSAKIWYSCQVHEGCLMSHD